MAAIFISHSSRDGHAASEVKVWLNEEGYEQVFLDFDKESGLDAGREWERQLYEAIARCQAVILLVTPAWLDSKWCFAEFTQARALGKVIFPLVVTADDRRLIGPPMRSIQAEQWDEAGQAHLARRLKEVADEIARGHRWDPSRPPWPGIMSFEAEDAAVFFGRDPEIREICERLEARRAQGGARLVLIVGASGGGKSSVLKAGVVPYLARDRRRFVTLPPFRPGRTPLMAFAKVLAEAMAPAKEFQSILDNLTGDNSYQVIADVVNALTVGPAREAAVLISIDQFEELFNLAGHLERNAFLRLLSTATMSDTEKALPILVVATVRSDLLSDVLKTDGLSIAHEVFTLPNVPSDRTASVICGPAQVASIHLGDGLVDRILKDLGATAEALPLLAFTLRELNQRHGADKKLTLLEYEELGDRANNLSPLENAVRRTAEETLTAAAPSADELAALRELFVGQLVRVNEDGVRLRRPANVKDIAPVARPLIDRLVTARLLSIRSEGAVVAVEVAHEALFKVWPQLTNWLDEEQNFLIGRRQIEDAARLWSSTPQVSKDKTLLSGLLLENAREWMLAHPERLKNVHEFVTLSIRKSDQEQMRARRRQRISIFASIAAAAVFGVLAIWASNERDIAETERSRAEQESKRAEEQTKRAEEQRKTAEGQKQRAEEQTKRAEEQTKMAEKATAETKEQTQRAEEQRKTAEDQRRRAEEQTNRAEEQTRIAERAAAETRKQRDVAIEAVDALVTAISQKLANVAGFASWKAVEVLKDAEKIADRVAGVDAADPTLMEKRVRTFHEFAKSYFAMSDPDLAYVNLGKAQELLKQLLTLTMDESLIRNLRARSLELEGDAKYEKHKYDEAAAAYSSALRFADAGTVKAMGLLRKLANAQMRLADWTQERTGRYLEQASVALGNARVISLNLAHDDTWAREDAELSSLDGDIRRRKGDSIAARKAYSDAIGSLSELIARYPFDNELVRLLGENELKLGDLERRAGNLALALSLYVRAKIHLNQVLEANPSNLSAQLSLNALYAEFRRMRENSGLKSIDVYMSSEDNLEIQYSEGVLPFKFGMSPNQVNTLFSAETRNRTAPTLAGEYKPTEIRYLWRYFKDLPDMSMFHNKVNCLVNDGYITFLFKEDRLFEISVRFMKGNNCPERDELISIFAHKYGLGVMTNPIEKRIKFEGRRVNVVGKSNSYGVDIAFIGK